MQSVAILLFILVTLFLVYQKYFAKRYAPITYRYKKVGSLMIGPEVAFYNALISAVENRALVFAKVHMADVLMPVPNKNKKKWLAAFNRISRKHLDFVICRPGTLEVLCIIEFDNGKELNKTKVEREKLLLHVCKTSGIPLIGANEKYAYQVGRLRKVLAEYVDTIEVEPEIRFCRECESPMVVKIGLQGTLKGKRYYTCSRHPNCKYTEDFIEEVNWS